MLDPTRAVGPVAAREARVHLGQERRVVAGTLAGESSEPRGGPERETFSAAHIQATGQTVLCLAMKVNVMSHVPREERGRLF